MNENKEIWRDIEGYEGLYKVSNLGRVKSIKFRTERILKPANNGCGYLYVKLCKNGEQNICLIHRLVAQVFISNPQNLPEINHKDEDKTNNKVENLEWCTTKYNHNYGTINQRIADKHSKTVLQYTKDGNFLQEWKSGYDIERNLGYCHGKISACCPGKQKTSYGFVWKYKK